MTTTDALTQNSQLTTGQVTQYHREGYLALGQSVLPEPKFAALKAYFESIIAALPASTRPEAIEVPHFVHPRLFAGGAEDRKTKDWQECGYCEWGKIDEPGLLLTVIWQTLDEV